MARNILWSGFDFSSFNITFAVGLLRSPTGAKFSSTSQPATFDIFFYYFTNSILQRGLLDMSILLYKIAGTHVHAHVLIILAEKLFAAFAKVISFRITK